MPFEQLYGGKKVQRTPPPSVAPPLPDDEPAVSDAVSVVDSAEEPGLSDPMTTEQVEEHETDSEDFGPVAVDPATLTVRAQRIAAEIEEMIATAQADAVKEATAPLEGTIQQLRVSLDERNAEFARLRDDNQALRARLEQARNLLSAA